MSFPRVARSWAARFVPARAHTDLRERAAACSGGFLGLLATAFVTRACIGPAAHVPLLIAPIGASTVLVFGVPASPLAQPWSVVGGNFVAAVVGVTVARLIHDPFAAGALAVGLTILLTSALRCLHPPAGAVALTAVIGGASVTQAGYAFAFVPVALSSALLVTMGVVFNALAKRSYPHVPTLPVSTHRTADAPPEFRVGFSASDIDAALERLGTPLDVERDDILALFRHVEDAAHERLRGEIFCADVMSRDLVTIHPDESSEVAEERLREHRLRVLPVVDERRVVHGALDLATAARASHVKVGDLPSISFEIAGEQTPIKHLFPLLSQGRAREALIVDEQRRLVGIITQTDLLAIVGRVQSALR